MTDGVELLVLAKDTRSATSLGCGLREAGFVVDIATDLPSARQHFLERGGHAALIIAPDVGSGAAREGIQALREVDPALLVIVFGEEVLREASEPDLHRIRSFHPGSRAGIGAIQQIVCSHV